MGLARGARRTGALRPGCCRLAVAAAVWALATPRPAVAQLCAPASDAAPAEPGGAIGVLPLRLAGELPPAFLEQLQARVPEGLGRGGREVVALELAGDCDAPCRVRAAEAAHARWIVTATVTARDRDFELALALLDARDGRELAATTATCEVCAVAEVGDMLADRAAVLGAKLDALATAPPRLRFVSRPGGAMIWIDGERVGAAPLERTLDAGRHRAKAVLEGHLPLELQFDAVAGTEEELTLTLSPVPPRARALRPAGATTLGIGVALAAVGVPLLVLHGRPFRGRCTGADVDVDGDCRFRYDTRTGGAIAIAIAGAAIVTGAVLLGVAARDRPRRRAHARVGLGVLRF